MPSTRNFVWLSAMLACLCPGLIASAHAAAASGRAAADRLPQDEVVYFLLPDRFDNGDPANDRGGLTGDRLRTGFDPTDKGFYHGGDLQGLLRRLDYLQGLGATALWVGPIFKNNPVQGARGQESAGYHGYWVTDFTRVDPHFGSESEFRKLVDAAHARGMKVYMDIIANHTADVIAYRECPDSTCPYRSKADYPYSRSVRGEPINEGFQGDDAAHQNAGNFAHLTRPDFAYTPFIPRGKEHLKVPDWLNDPLLYHNRGESTFKGESSEFGDFAGLDDLMTENPRVVQGFIDIYGRWIDDYGIDGYRIDTARHVNAEFWRAFVPAMQTRAAARGIPHFHIFGEVFTETPDTALLARFTRVTGMPAVLDFAFATAVRQAIAGDAGTAVLARVFEDDALYEGGAPAALQMPTFISNHDMGRFAHFVRKQRSTAPDDEVLRRVELAHAMLMTLRGVPVIYYGDEQGFAGAGHDQDARQDMFASAVESYNRDTLVGSGGSTATANFNTSQPLYRLLASLAATRNRILALRRGEQVLRHAGETPGLFAVSRIDPSDRHEVLIAFNTSTQPLKAQVQVGASARRFRAVQGDCAAQVNAPGSYRVDLPALGFVICEQADTP